MANLEILEVSLANAKTTPEKITALNALAWELRNNGTARVQPLAEEAFVLSEQTANKKGLAESTLLLASCEEQRSNYALAKDLAEQSRVLFQSLGDRKGESYSLNLLGTVCWNISDYPKALDYFEQSLKIRQTIGDMQGVSSSLNNLGNLYDRIYDYPKALAYLQQCLQLSTELSYHSMEATALLNISDVYNKLGENTTALSYGKRSLDICQTYGYKNFEANALLNLGNTYRGLSDYAKASAYYEKSLKLSQAIDDRRCEAYSWLHIGNLFLKARYIWSPTANTEVSTIGCLHQALTIANDIQSKEIVFEAHEALSQAYEQVGDMGLALEHYKLFHASRQDVFNEEQSRKLQNQIIASQVEQARKDAEIYRLKNVVLAEALAEAESLRKVAEQQAREDGLTGLYNRRQFNFLFENEFSRARRYHIPLSVAIADIDFFKKVNDTYSHEVGDKVLRTFAKIIKQSCRETDVVARYGGEEFVFVFPETAIENAVHACEKIRLAVESFDWSKVQQGLRVTMSMGVSSDTTVENHEKMLAIADAKLYEAKYNGRNQVRH
jgi:diguanylate cyclase (GGDEF)-like protein